MKKLEKLIFKNYDFYLNVINQKVYFSEKGKNAYKELSEIDINSILYYLRSKKISVTKVALTELLYSDAIPNINPIEKYFKKLNENDSKLDYIKELSSTVNTTNQDFFERAFKKWLVGLIACALNPNLTNQQALILCGKQGCGKTTWLESLLPSELREYLYNGTTDPNNKDTILAMSQYLLMNMDEMSDYNSKQVESFKQMITKTVISERKVYARSTCNYPRICSFAGSSNEKGILTDPTGNRRFLCFEVVGNIDFKHNIDINKVMAQAFELYNSGFKYYFEGQEIEEIEENNKNFMKTNSTHEIIQSLFDVPKEGESDTVLMNATDICNFIRIKYRSFSISAEALGKLMTGLGFKSRKDKRQIKKYIVKLIKE